MPDLTPFEWLFALALNLERGEMHVLDGFRTGQVFKKDGGKHTILLTWELLGESVCYSCPWHSPHPPSGPVELVKHVKTKVIAWALATLEREIAAAIAAKEAENA